MLPPRSAFSPPLTRQQHVRGHCMRAAQPPLRPAAHIRALHSIHSRGKTRGGGRNNLTGLAVTVVWGGDCVHANRTCPHTCRLAWYHGPSWGCTAGVKVGCMRTGRAHVPAGGHGAAVQPAAGGCARRLHQPQRRQPGGAARGRGRGECQPAAAGADPAQIPAPAGVFFFTGYPCPCQAPSASLSCWPERQQLRPDTSVSDANPMRAGVYL